MRVELIAVGTELLLGDVVNTNVAWLGGRLAEAGIDVTRTVAVGDNIPRIAAAISVALEGAAPGDAVIVTGGLGPTQDDVTREALAKVAGVELVRDAELERALHERYAAFGHTEMPANNLRMADVPAGAQVLPAEVGAAPGLVLSVRGRVVYAVPGVPAEMRDIITRRVLPDLALRATSPAVLVSRVVHTAGLAESVIADRLARLHTELDSPGSPTMAYLASGGEVVVRLTAKAPDRDQALAVLSPVSDQVVALLGAAVYGFDDDTLDVAVHRLLAARRATVAVAESLTGGLLGSALTTMAGSSATFAGGVIAYTAAAKSELLAVPADLLAAHGPVHPAVAAAMAAGVREALGATYGVATTGEAGPDAQTDAPVGTVELAVSGPGGEMNRSLRLVGDREQVRRRTVTEVLDLLRRHLVEGG